MAAVLSGAFARSRGDVDVEVQKSSNHGNGLAVSESSSRGLFRAGSGLSASSSGAAVAAERAAGPWRCSLPGRRALGAATLAGQVAFLVLFVVQPRCSGFDASVTLVFVQTCLCFAMSVLFLVFAVAFEHFSRNARDAVTARAKCYTYLVAAYLLAMAGQVFIYDRCSVKLSWDIWALIADQSSTIMFVLVEWFFFGLVEERLRLTEAGFGRSLGSLRVRRLRLSYVGAMALAEALGFATTACEQAGCNPSYVHFAVWLRLQLHDAILSASYLSIGLVTFRGFSSVLRSMGSATLPLASYARREQQWAKKVFQLLRAITLLQCTCSSAVHIFTFSMYFYEDWVILCGFVYVSAQPLLFLMEMVFLLTITGLCQPRRSSELQLRKGLDPPPSVAGTRTCLWRATLEALASRGLSVGALLDFYERLGKPDGPMPHFKPNMTTTNDVVRQAIIPLSKTAAGGVAYVDLVSDVGGRPLPEVMVTHTWTSLFLDLVSAVVADAYGLEEYESTAAILASGGCEQLRRGLEQCCGLGRVYWICAFAVNQHAGICNSVGQPPADTSPRFARWDHGRRDTVSGDVFPLCDCSQPKYLNDSSPEECELNKFDDMIELLSCRVDGFTQLVVVDRDLSVFTRAWCVAELHRAHAMGLNQKVCMHTSFMLDLDANDLAVYAKLAALTVTTCEASRPQDKEDILRKIPDTQEFDEQLQEVIFGSRGILRRQFEDLGVLEAAARTAFRVSQMQSSLNWQAV